MNKHHRLLLGAHTSIAGSPDKAFERGLSLGCTTLQIFTKSNRQWHAKKLDPQEIDTYHVAQKTTGINPVVAHASYLINLGSPDKATRLKSITALSHELERCTILDIPYLVIHPGSHVQSGEQTCLDHIIEGLHEVLTKDTGSTMILLETMSGQGSTVCYTFEQLAYIMGKTHPAKRLGVCLDMCHVFVAGYDLRTTQGYDELWQKYDDILGLKTLKVIHVNDSKKPCGSRIDRHEHIGQGMIGAHAFKLLMNDKRFFDIPKILETPIDDQGDHAHNLATLRRFLTEETTRLLY